MNTKRELNDIVTQRIEFRFALLLATSLSHDIVIAAEAGTPNDPDTRPYGDIDQWQI